MPPSTRGKQAQAELVAEHVLDDTHESALAGQLPAGHDGGGGGVVVVVVAVGDAVQRGAAQGALGTLPHGVSFHQLASATPDQIGIVAALAGVSRMTWGSAQPSADCVTKR